jgi:hypothetical protein
MRCLTDKQLQLLVDDELTAGQKKKYLNHIEVCSLCAKKYRDRIELVASIKASITEAVKLPKSIPEFRIPTKPTGQEVRMHRIPLWVKVAAVLVPAIIGWKLYDKPQEILKPNDKSMQVYEMCNGVDANTAFQENMIVTTVTDENGNVLECSTN